MVRRRWHIEQGMIPMSTLRLELDGLKVESFEAGTDAAAAEALGGCSVQPTCGNPSRGDETYEKVAITRYACCV